VASGGGGQGTGGNIGGTGGTGGVVTTPQQVGSGVYYVDWVNFVCVKDCPISSGDPRCGGLKKGWDDGYSTADECCSSKLSWVNHEECTPHVHIPYYVAETQGTLTINNFVAPTTQSELDDLVSILTQTITNIITPQLNQDQTLFEVIILSIGGQPVGRRLSSEDRKLRSAVRDLQSGSVVVEFKVVFEDLCVNPDCSGETAPELTLTITNSVSSGAFTTALRQTANAAGVTSLNTATVSANTFSDTTIAALSTDLTKSPTRSPTPKPSAVPSLSPSTQFPTSVPSTQWTPSKAFWRSQSSFLAIDSEAEPDLDDYAQDEDRAEGHVTLGVVTGIANHDLVKVISATISTRLLLDFDDFDDDNTVGGVAGAWMEILAYQDCDSVSSCASVEPEKLIPGRIPLSGMSKQIDCGDADDATFHTAYTSSTQAKFVLNQGAGSSYFLRARLIVKTKAKFWYYQKDLDDDDTIRPIWAYGDDDDHRRKLSHPHSNSGMWVDDYVIVIKDAIVADL
jgi:hypothetical protein